VLVVVTGFVLFDAAAPVVREPDGVPVTFAVSEPVSDTPGAEVVTGAAVVVTPDEAAAVVTGTEPAVEVAELCVTGAWPRVFGSIKEGE
jgi:hypothetical protein